MKGTNPRSGGAAWRSVMIDGMGRAQEGDVSIWPEMIRDAEYPGEAKFGVADSPTSSPDCCCCED